MLRADRRTLSRSPRLVDFCVSGSSIIVSFPRRRLSISRRPRPCSGGGAGGVGRDSGSVSLEIGAAGVKHTENRGLSQTDTLPDPFDTFPLLSELTARFESHEAGSRL